MLKEKILLSNNCTYVFDNISIDNNLMTIVFSDEIDIKELSKSTDYFNDIKILTRGDIVCAEYENFNTIYKIEDQTLILSNDKSIYSEENPSQDIIEPEPTLEETKENKIQELSSICNQKIALGITMNIDGKEESFSYKDVDQTNIKDAFELAQQTQMSVPYHADNQGCKLYTIEQITQLYINEKINLTHHTTYFNQLKMFVLNLSDIASIKSVEYGQPLIGEYLNDYNLIMKQANLIMQTFIKRGEN